MWVPQGAAAAEAAAVQQQQPMNPRQQQGCCPLLQTGGPPPARLQRALLLVLLCWLMLHRLPPMLVPAGLRLQQAAAPWGHRAAYTVPPRSQQVCAQQRVWPGPGRC